MANRKENGKSSLEGLRKLAQDYGVSDNAMVCEAFSQYAFQLDVIKGIQKELNESGSLMTSKEYVKGRENVYANPLIKELPKHCDSANKTAQVIMDLIENFGKPPKEQSKLEELMNQ